MAKKLARVPCGFVLVPPLYLFILSRPISQLFSCRLLLAWGHPSSFLLLLALPQHPSSATPPPNNASPSILLMSLFEFLDFFLGLSFPFVGGVRDTVGINEYHDVL